MPEGRDGHVPDILSTRFIVSVSLKRTLRRREGGICGVYDSSRWARALLCARVVARDTCKHYHTRDFLGRRGFSKRDKDCGILLHPLLWKLLRMRPRRTQAFCLLRHFRMFAVSPPDAGRHAGLSFSFMSLPVMVGDVLEVPVEVFSLLAASRSLYSRVCGLHLSLLCYSGTLYEPSYPLFSCAHLQSLSV